MVAALLREVSLSQCALCLYFIPNIRAATQRSHRVRAGGAAAGGLQEVSLSRCTLFCRCHTFNIWAATQRRQTRCCWRTSWRRRCGSGSAPFKTRLMRGHRRQHEHKGARRVRVGFATPAGISFVAFCSWASDTDPSYGSPACRVVLRGQSKHVAPCFGRCGGVTDAGVAALAAGTLRITT